MPLLPVPPCWLSKDTYRYAAHSLTHPRMCLSRRQGPVPRPDRPLRLRALRLHLTPHVFVCRAGRGLYLDPTGPCGSAPCAYPSPGSWWPLPIQTELAFVNEPPPGSSSPGRAGPNCRVEDGASDEAELLFVTSRDVGVGEELTIDYGMHYDRSGYGRT